MPATVPPAAKIEQRKRRKSVRREEILDAARNVFAQKGFEGTTVVDVARVVNEEGETEEVTVVSAGRDQREMEV